MKSRLALALAPLVVDLDTPLAGWVTRSLMVSIRRSAMIAVASWQLIVVVATVATLGAQSWPLATANLALAGLALALMRMPHAGTQWMVPAAMIGLGFAAFVASGDIASVLVFAAAWQIRFAAVVAGLLVFSRWALPATIVIAAMLAIAIVMVLPGWGPQIAFSIPVTLVVAVAALRIGLPVLLAFAARADAEEAVAERAQAQEAISHRVSRQLAEEARVLHDTAINTLAAIAVGGATVRDPALVRAECRRNVEVLQGLRGEQTGQATRTAQFADLFDLPGMPVTRSGLSDTQLAALARSLVPAVVGGLVLAAREAVVNANKHASATRIAIDVAATAEAVCITVRDDGVGFDPSDVAMRGIATSIFRRVEDLGCTAQLDTAPGRGTMIVLSAPLAVAEAPETDDDDTQRVVVDVQRRAGLLWGGGITLVSLVLVLAFGRGHQPLVLAVMLLVMGLAWAIVAWGRTSTQWVACSLVLAIVGVFLLSAAGVAFGTDGAVHWHALAATGPFILLLALRPQAWVLRAAVIAWVVVVGGAALVTLQTSAVGAAITVLAGVIGGAFTFVWARFMRRVTVFGATIAAAHRRAAEAQRAAAADQAARGTYQLWVNAGLEAATELLRNISEGERDPQELATQAACGAEEAHLRQLILISPELVYLAPAMVAVLGRAREREVSLRLRLGGQDVPNRATAQAVADAVSEAVDSAAVSQRVSASLFAVHDGLQLTLVHGAQGGSLGEIRQRVFAVAS